MARPTKPTALKILQGTARKDRINSDEPQYDIEIPEPPQEVKGRALAEWNRISPLLDSMRLISHADRAALAAYCIYYADFQNAVEHIAEHGQTVESPNGYPIASPYIAIRNKSAELMRKYINEFGLSPASRGKVSAGKQKEKENPFAKLSAVK